MPRRTPTSIKVLARQHTTLAINTLAAICRGSDNDSARVNAAEALLDRGYGRVKPDPEGAEQVTVTIRKIFEHHLNGSEEIAKLPLIIEHNEEQRDE